MGGKRYERHDTADLPCGSRPRYVPGRLRNSAWIYLTHGRGILGDTRNYMFCIQKG